VDDEVLKLGHARELRDKVLWVELGGACDAQELKGEKALGMLKQLGAC